MAAQLCTRSPNNTVPKCRSLPGDTMATRSPKHNVTKVTPYFATPWLQMHLFEEQLPGHYTNTCSYLLCHFLKPSSAGRQCSVAAVGGEWGNQLIPLHMQRSMLLIQLTGSRTTEDSCLLTVWTPTSYSPTNTTNPLLKSALSVSMD